MRSVASGTHWARNMTADLNHSTAATALQSALWHTICQIATLAVRVGRGAGEFCTLVVGFEYFVDVVQIGKRGSAVRHKWDRGFRLLQAGLALFAVRPI